MGHGLRGRTVEGPPGPGAPPTQTEIVSRRYLCRACGAILVVLPLGIGRGFRYALAAIGWALSLWSHEHTTAAEARTRTSTAKTVGASSLTCWASLRRWTRCAPRLFGVVPRATGTLRERAAVVAGYVAAQALLSTGRVAIDAFFGAPFCASR